MTWPAARRTGLAAVCLALLLAAVTGSTAAATMGSALSTAPPQAEAQAGSFRSVRRFDEVAEPVRVRIPSAGVDSRLQRLGRAADGSVEVPASFDEAGWFADGPRPGQAGPAVLLGHLDSRTGPGVFFALPRLAAGTEVVVDRADGSTVTFHVSRTVRVPKTAFPTDLVYGATLQPSLRLVTCGGDFNREAGSYRDNVIVYADLTS